MRVFLRESFVPVLVVLGLLSAALVSLRRLTEVRSRAATVIRIRAEDLVAEPVPRRAAPTSAPGDDTSDTDHHKMAPFLRMAAHDSLTQALALTQTMLDANAQDSGAWFARGLLLTRAGKRDLAIEAYRHAAQYATGRARSAPLYNLGKLYRDAGRDLEAADAFKKALAERPNYLQARLSLAGLIAQEPNRRVEARRMYEQLLRLAPTYPEAYYNRGLLGMQEGKLDSARVDFERAVAVDSTFAKAWLNLGVLHSRAKRKAAAEVAYRRAIAVDPSQLRARLNLAILLGNQPSGHAEAHQLYAQLVEMAPSNVEILCDRGMLEIDEGDLERARADLEAAIRLDPKYAKAYFELGVVHTRLGRPEAAIAAYRGAVLADAEYEKARVNLAVLLAKQKRYREAADINREIVAKDPSYSRAWFNLGIALGRLNDLRAAMAAYRRVIALDGGNARAWQNLGVLYVRQNDLDQAVQCYREALAADPGYEIARYNLALAYHRQGKKDLAQQEIARLARLAPDHPRAQRLVTQFAAETGGGKTVPASSSDGGDDEAPGR